MNHEKLGFKESFKIFIKALKVSVKTRSKLSLVVNLLGFPMAFLPMLVSIWVSNFSNRVQEAYGKGEGLIISVVGGYG